MLYHSLHAVLPLGNGVLELRLLHCYRQFIIRCILLSISGHTQLSFPAFITGLPLHPLPRTLSYPLAQTPPHSPEVVFERLIEEHDVLWHHCH